MHRRTTALLAAGALVTAVLQATSAATASAAAAESLYTSTAATGRVDADTGSVTLGTRFSTDVAGTVSGVTFYRGTTANKATRVSLWSSDGRLLGTASAGTATGWVSGSFAAPVPVQPATTYVVSYAAPSGRYNVVNGGFSASRVVGHLRTASGAGVYTYSSVEAFPRSTYASSEYIVSPLFSAGSPTAPSPSASATPSPTPSTAPTPVASPTPSSAPTVTPTPSPSTSAPGSAQLPHDPAFVGPSYYGKWSNGFSTSPSFFPIGVYNQTPQNANAPASAWKAWGANTFVSLYSYGDAAWTQSALDAAAGAGMNVIGEASPDADGFRNGTVSRADVVQPDEPDYNGVVPSTYDASVQRDQAADPQRPTFGNFTKGMAYGGFGRSDADMSTYCRNLGIVSGDIYGITDPWEQGGSHAGVYIYGRMIDRIHALCPGKPAWGFVETTQPSNTAARPTPDQAEAAVWSILVHGGRGVSYFIHDFYGADGPSNYAGDYALLVDPLAKPVKDRLQQVNTQIASLAPVLNAPTVPLTATSDGAAPVTALGKDDGGRLWVLAQGDGNETHTSGASVNGTVEVPVANGTVFEVVGEGRTLTVANGTLVDHFNPYQHHTYRAL